MASVSTSYSPETLCFEEITMNDFVVENFHSLVKQGVIVNNQMTSSHVRLDNVLSSGTIWGTDECTKIDFAIDYVRERQVPYLTAPSGMSSEIDSMVKTASTRSMANVSSAEINLPAIIGELTETKEMLAKTLRSVWHLSDTLEHFGRLIRYGSSKNLSKPLTKRERYKNYYLALENFWMELRMGWRPFIHQCVELHNMVQKKKAHPPRQTFRGKTTKEFTRSDRYTSIGARMCVFKRTYSNTVIVRAGTMAQQRAFGFPDTYGLTKLPQAIWELTTLSWAVDYFFNIGDAIAAYVPDTLWEPLCSWYKVEQHITQTIELERSYQADGTFTPDIRGGFRIKNEIKKERHPCAYLGISFFPKMNFAKYIDILGVTRQRFDASLKFFQSQIPRKKRR